jgi:hypothetical protein
MGKKVSSDISQDINKYVKTEKKSPGQKKNWGGSDEPQKEKPRAKASWWGGSLPLLWIPLEQENTPPQRMSSL